MLASKTKFKTKVGHKIAAAMALGLSAFAIAGFGIPVMDYSLFNILKPLDYLFLLNCAFVFGMASLSFKRGRRRFVVPSFTQLPRYAHQIRLSFPRGI